MASPEPETENKTDSVIINPSNPETSSTFKPDSETPSQIGTSTSTQVESGIGIGVSSSTEANQESVTKQSNEGSSSTGTPVTGTTGSGDTAENTSQAPEPYPYPYPASESPVIVHESSTSPLNEPSEPGSAVTTEGSVISVADTELATATTNPTLPIPESTIQIPTEIPIPVTTSTPTIKTSTETKPEIVTVKTVTETTTVFLLPSTSTMRPYIRPTRRPIIRLRTTAPSTPKTLQITTPIPETKIISTTGPATTNPLTVSTSTSKPTTTSTDKPTIATTNFPKVDAPTVTLIPTTVSTTTQSPPKETTTNGITYIIPTKRTKPVKSTTPSDTPDAPSLSLNAEHKGTNELIALTPEKLDHSHHINSEHYNFAHLLIIIGTVLITIGFISIMGGVVMYCWRKNKGIARARANDMDGRTLSFTEGNDELTWLDDRDHGL